MSALPTFVSQSNALIITATQFNSFTTPAISVPFPSAYAQTQVQAAFVYTATPTYAANAVISTIGGVAATAGASQPISVAGPSLGDTGGSVTGIGGVVPTATSSSSGGSRTAASTSIPVWQIAVIAVAGAIGVLLLALGIYFLCRRNRRRRELESSKLGASSSNLYQYPEKATTPGRATEDRRSGKLQRPRSKALDIPTPPFARSQSSAPSSSGSNSGYHLHPEHQQSRTPTRGPSFPAPIFDERPNSAGRGTPSRDPRVYAQAQPSPSDESFGSRHSGDVDPPSPTPLLQRQRLAEAASQNQHVVSDGGKWAERPRYDQQRAPSQPYIQSYSAERRSRQVEPPMNDKFYPVPARDPLPRPPQPRQTRSYDNNEHALHPRLRQQPQQPQEHHQNQTPLRPSPSPRREIPNFVGDRRAVLPGGGGVRQASEDRQGSEQFTSGSPRRGRPKGVGQAPVGYDYTR